MIKVTVSDEEGENKSCLVSETETPKNILKYYHVNPDIRTIYMNGVALSKERMNKPVPKVPHIHIKVAERDILKPLR